MDPTHHQDRRNPGTAGHPSGTFTGKAITISKSGSSTKEPSSLAMLNKLPDMYIYIYYVYIYILCIYIYIMYIYYVCMYIYILCMYIYIFMIIFLISDVMIATDDMRDTFLDIAEKILVPSLR